ncbi:MAG: dipicolinate synthase subunit B [Oscillospiraceae bacterium]|jgi:dipicolinate synthase subunit B|nr:dipicolinate synthase subunit B [Oscillospiraceae bacterium]
MNTPIRVGFAVCGSFCSLAQAMTTLEELTARDYELWPIMSENAYATDTRFGRAALFIEQMEALCARPVRHTIAETEPIGPRRLLDVLTVVPCTGNTLAKLACGITDTSVTMACKAHLRNERPLVLAIASNDALAANWHNIGRLSARKHVYFVPFGQDDPVQKQNSLVSDFSLLPATLEAALAGSQLQPLLTPPACPVSH